MPGAGQRRESWPSSLRCAVRKGLKKRGPVISILKKERDIIKSKWSRIPGCEQAMLTGTEMGKWVLLPGSV